VSWRALSEIAREMWASARRRPPPHGVATDARAAAGWLAMDVYGPAAPAVNPPIVNVAALALAMRDRMEVHEMRHGAARLVAETRLGGAPSEAPRLLAGAWLIESQRPDRGERLWGTTFALGGYRAPDGRHCLVGLLWPDTARVAFWAPRWTGEEFGDAVPTHGGPFVADVQGHDQWAARAAEYATALALLLDARHAPIRSTERGARAARSTMPRDSGVAVVRHVALDPAAARVIAGHGVARQTDQVREDSLPDHGNASLPTVTGGSPHVAPIAGHLRRVPRGPGGREREWTWIPAYNARRYGAERVTVRVGVRT